MANRSVVLYERTKIRKERIYRKVAEVLSKLACGDYYVSWDDGSRKRMDPAGRDPEQALAALEKKRLELAFVAASGQVKKPDNKTSLEAAFLTRQTAPTPGLDSKML